MRYLIATAILLLNVVLFGDTAQETFSFKIKKKKPQKFFYDKYLAYLNNKKNPLGNYDYIYSFGGQISYDIGYIDRVPDPLFAKDFRRIRLTHEGSFLHKTYFYALEYSFTGNENYKDLFVGYKNKHTFEKSTFRLKGGNQKVAFSISRYSSSKNLSFMERPLSDVFSLQRKMALEFAIDKKLQNHLFNLFLSYFENSIDERQDELSNKPGYALRGGYTFKTDKRKLLYFGYSYMYQDYNDDTLRYKQEAESNLIDEKYLSVKIKNVRNIANHHLDIYYQHNKFYTLASYTRSNIEAQKDNYSFDAYDIELSYFLLGSGKKFNTFSSKFSSIRPKKDGAVETAFRYSYLNLNDKDEHGGEESDYNFALNYYISKELKVMFNYVLVFPKNTDNYDGMFNIYQMRMQFAF